MQNLNSAMTLVRPGPVRVVETAGRRLMERTGMAQFSRATWRAGRFHVIAVVVILFGWPVLLFLVFADCVLLDPNADGVQPLPVRIAAGVVTFSERVGPDGWLAVWDGRDIEATTQAVVLILVGMALFFGCLMAILMKFCTGQ